MVSATVMYVVHINLHVLMSLMCDIVLMQMIGNLSLVILLNLV